MRKFVDATDSAFTSGIGVGAFKGAVLNLSNSQYHSCDKYWSSTHLKAMVKKSAKHFHYEYISKPKEEKTQTEQLLLGSAVHTWTLEPDNFDKEFFVMPELNLRTNEGKATKEKLIADNPGRTPLSKHIHDEAMIISQKILENETAKKLLFESGRREASYFWTCPFSGLNMRAKLDHSSSQHFVELKTTSKFEPEEFQKQAYNLHYDLSLFHYKEALKQVMDIDVPAFFIVVETEAPYDVIVYKAGDSLYQTGNEKWVRAVSALERGLKQNEWPSYFPKGEIPELNSPAWAMKKFMTGDEGGI
jgi:hypothetical protein